MAESRGRERSWPFSSGRYDDFHSGYQERNVSRLSHRSKAKVNAKESDQRGMKRDSGKGHMKVFART